MTWPDKMHSKLAVEAWPDGVTLECRCGHQEQATVEQLAGYLEHGWPEHCHEIMRAL